MEGLKDFLHRFHEIDHPRFPPQPPFHPYSSVAGSIAVGKNQLSGKWKILFQ
jgi:hypothetical protein